MSFVRRRVAGRYCLLDMSYASEVPKSLPTWRGRVLGSFRRLRDARELASRRIRHGHVFVVVVDAVDGRQVFPHASNHPAQEHPRSYWRSTRSTIPESLQRRRLVG